MAIDTPFRRRAEAPVQVLRAVVSNVIAFPRVPKPQKPALWEQAVQAVAHLDAETLSTGLAHTSRLVVRSVRAHDVGAATEHLLTLRAKVDQLLAAFGEQLADRGKRPDLDLLLSQLDAAGQAEEQARAEALIAAIYACSDAARMSKTRDGGTP